MQRRRFVKQCAVGSLLAGCLRAAASADPQQKPDKGSAFAPERMVKPALEHYQAGKRTCAESILMAGCEALAIKSDLVPDIALGLTGGVGFQGETCGVLTASAMVLSLALAKRDYETRRQRMTTVLFAVRRVHRAFREQLGHSDCRSLCGLDLNLPAAQERLQYSVRNQKCIKFVELGARLLAGELQATLANPPS